MDPTQSTHLTRPNTK